MFTRNCSCRTNKTQPRVVTSRYVCVQLEAIVLPVSFNSRTTPWCRRSCPSRGEHAVCDGAATSSNWSAPRDERGNKKVGQEGTEETSARMLTTASA